MPVIRREFVLIYAETDIRGLDLGRVSAAAIEAAHSLAKYIHVDHIKH